MIQTPFLAVDGIVEIYDANEAFVYAPDNLPMEKLVFDHAKILGDYLERR